MMRSAFENMLMRRKPMLSQRINWQHPMVCDRSLVGCWLMAEAGGGIARDLASGVDGTDSNITHTTGSTNGYARVFNGSSGKIDFTSSLTNLTANWTLLFRVKRLATNAQHALWARWTNSTTARELAIYFTNGALSDNKLYVDIPFIAAIFSSTSQITDTNWHDVVVTRLGSDWTIYFDGIIDATASNATAQESGPAPTIGTNPPVGGYWLNGYMDHAYAFNRCLSAKEVMQLYVDPFCFMQPLPLWPLNVTAAAASAMLKRMQTEGLFCGRGI